MHLVVTGASGLLGLNLSLVATSLGYDVTGLVHSTLIKETPFAVEHVNLLQVDTALQLLETIKPDAIIHCAAIADLNYAEQHPELAQKMNGYIPGILAKAALQWEVPFIHISTDAVFDGEKGDYSELDVTNPLSVYAKTKLAGEQAVMDQNPSAVVARVVFFGWSLRGDRSLSEFFFNNLKDSHQVRGFIDTFFCPLYVEHLAEVLLEILNAGLSGLYHVVSSQSLSKYDFGIKIARTFGFDPGLIEPVQRSQGPDEAKRASNLVLRSDKLMADLGHEPPSVDDGIERMYQRWQQGYPEKLQRYQAA